VGRAAAAITVPGRVAEAEALWYDPQRWASWVDGFGHVDRLEGDWPRPGARLVWDSLPGGRGKVMERVSAHTDGAGQALDVEDERLRGTQRVAFAPDGDAVRVTLALDYELKQRAPLTPVIDLLFIRRAIRDSLTRTLRRFANERAAELSG